MHELRFKSREEAEDWIDKNQLGRRNLTHDAFTMLLGRRYKRAKKGHGRRGPEKTDQNDQSFGTAEKLAVEHGVSPATVRRAEKFYDEVAINRILRKEAAERKKAGLKKGSKKPVSTKRSTRGKRDTKARDAASTAGQVAAKAGVSLRKAKQAVKLDKGPARKMSHDDTFI